jgi:uncharacterized membrane-anchored protein
MKTKILIAAFIVIALIQLLVPGRMILHYEKILETGKKYKFNIAPIDPSDPFRGKYLAISVREHHFAVDSINDWKKGEEIYVSINTNTPDSMAVISNISRLKPGTGTDFIVARVGYVYNKIMDIEYPFDRYYMDESVIPEATVILAKAWSDTTQMSYIVVNAVDGKAVLNDIIISGKSIKEFK